MVLFDILSHYIVINSSHWLKKDVQWILDKIFREPIMVSMASKLYSFNSLGSFRILHVFVVIFIIIRLIVMSRLLLLIDKHHFFLIGV